MVTKYLKKKIAIALVAAMAIGGVTPTQIVPSFKMENVKASDGNTAEPTATPAPKMEASFDYDTKLLTVGELVGSGETVTAYPVKMGINFYYQSVLYTGADFATAGELKSNKWTAIEVGAQETYGATKHSFVDFSWLNCAKKQDLYIAMDPTAVAEGTEAPVKITINAQSSNLKIKYYGTKPADTVATNLYVGNDITGYLVSEAAKTGATPVDITTTQYKTENGSWTNVTTGLATELLKYINKGVKLQFRVAPSSADKNVAGKTVTVSVPAKANGPKVTVDYNKQQITFPKGSEYILSTAYGVGAVWTAAPSEGSKVKALYFDDAAIGYNGTAAKTFYVRTVAKQNKACSKITVVTIGAQVTVAEGVVNVANGTDLLATAYDANNADTKEKVFIQYKTPYDKSSGLLITNNSNKAYQVAVVKKTDIAGYYSETGNAGEVSYDFTAMGSKMIIGENTSKIKFTDVKAYTVNKTTGAVTKAGSATIATKDLFKKVENVTPEISDYVILYRQYDKSSKTNTAPAKTYMVPMAAVLEQAVTLKLKDAESALTPYVANAATTAAIKASQELTLTLDKQTNTTSVAKVTIWKDADCKQANTEVRATVAKDATNKNVNKITLTVSKDTIKTAYVKVVWEGVEKVYYISYAK